jgi:hypothetical protein
MMIVIKMMKMKKNLKKKLVSYLLKLRTYKLKSMMIVKNYIDSEGMHFQARMTMKISMMMHQLS